MQSILQRHARVTLFAGHYGSGKSTAAMAFAAALRAAFPQDPIAVADLDIVNPYFRTKDCAEQLAALGVELIASDYASGNVDVPALPGSAYRVTEDRSLRCVIDVGGDDRGALALGRYAPALKAEGDYDMLGVINCFRPLTRTPEDTVAVLREIEEAGGLPFTALVNNPALGRLTTPEDVLASADYAAAVSRLMGIPVAFTAARRSVCEALPDGMLLLPLDHTISHGGIENN